MNLFLWMLVQWTSKVCPFRISKDNVWVQMDLISLFYKQIMNEWIISFPVGDERREALCDGELAEWLPQEESYASAMEGATLPDSVLPATPTALQRPGTLWNYIIHIWHGHQRLYTLLTPTFGINDCPLQIQFLNFFRNPMRKLMQIVSLFAYD